MKFEISEYIATLPDGEEYFICRCFGKDDTDIWKIKKDCYTINIDGEFEYESLPSNRTEDYLKNNRFSLEKAKEILLKIETEK
ncbi:MAG: hypothetical protein AABY22_22840 [Nanoarchaeota archaeon]